MGLENSIVEDILIELPYISDEQVASVRKQVEQTGQSWHQTTLSSELMHEADLLKAGARKLGIGWTTLPLEKLNQQLMHQLDKRLATVYRMIMFDGDEQVRHVAMVNPSDIDALAFLKHHRPGKLKIYLTSESAILRALDQYDSQFRQINQLTEQKISSTKTAQQTLTRILEHAVTNNASDIHIEPQTSCLQVRYRIDGQLKNTSKLPSHVLLTLAREVKHLASLDVYQHRTAQHGQFSLEVDCRPYLFNVSIIPTVAGQKIALKVISQGGKLPSLAELGFLGDNLKQLSQILAEPDGLILFCGFNRCGKTSSIYSCLELLKQANLNIATVEESAKRRLDGISQLQLNHQTGLDHISAINILNHQDLDVMMIDGIRTRTVAELVVEVATSGRLVLAGVYAPDVCSGIKQLLDMGIPPYLLASKLRAVVGQRLVRQLVPDKAESYSPSKQELSQISRYLNLSAKNSWTTITRQTAKLATELKLTGWQELKLHRPKKTAQTSAYKSSLNLNEVLIINQKMREAIVAEAEMTKLQVAAHQANMTSLAHDGLIKASLGLTSIEEVLRVL